MRTPRLRLTSCTLDHTHGLREDGLPGAQGIDVVPDLVTGLVRVDRGHAGGGVRQGLGEPSDVFPIGLQTGGDHEGLVGDCAARCRRDGIDLRGKGVHVLGDVGEVGGDERLERLAGFDLLLETCADQRPAGLEGMHPSILA